MNNGSGKSEYEKLGVDPHKEKVRKIFGRIVRNDFPGAFVNIIREPGRGGYVKTMHSDGDGSKFIQRILHYMETGDSTVIQGAVDDGFSMNTGDIAASGFVGTYEINQTININGFNIPKDVVMAAIAERVETLIKLYSQYKIAIDFFGGETADLPDQVNSVVYDVNVFSRAKEANIVTGNVKPGDVIYGFASDGAAVWEETDNSGIMSNGLTMARIFSMDKKYGIKYPYLIRKGGEYRGNYLFDSQSAILGKMKIGEAILSPTRQWAILIKVLFSRLFVHDAFYMLHGISMNTGGGASKIKHVGREINYVKEMPVPPAIFQFLQAESGEQWKNMFTTFNCGVGIDIVGQNDEKFIAALEETSSLTGIKLYELGRCEASKTGANQVTLQSEYGTFEY